MYIWLADITTSVYNCIPHTIHIAATFYDLGCDTRKPVFKVSNNLLIKPAYSATTISLNNEIFYEEALRLHFALSEKQKR